MIERWKRVVALLSVGGAVAVGTGCETCDTVGGAVFVGVGGATETFSYRENTDGPFPRARGAGQCWAEMGRAWGRLTLRQPNVWVPTHVNACASTCWQPTLFPGC